MNELIDEIKILLAGKYQYANETMMNYFQTEDYPAICFEPERIKFVPQHLGTTEYDEIMGLKLIYIEKAEKNRNIRNFTENAKTIAKELGKLKIVNSGIEIIYKSRNGNDNMEFLAEIYIRGEK